MLVTVFATKAFEYHDHFVEAGEAFQTTVIDALRLRGAGKVSLSLRPERRLRASTSGDSGRQADIHRPDPDQGIVERPTVDTDLGTAHAMTADDQSGPPRRPRRVRRSYRRSEVDVDETTELEQE